MSTNFYLKKIPTQPRLKEIKDFIDAKVPSFKKMLNERFFISRKELSDFINTEFPSEDCLYSYFVSNSSDYAVQKVRDFRWDLEQRIDSYDIEFNDDVKGILWYDIKMAFDEFCQDFEEAIENFDFEVVHLGKRSGGWQFLFRYYKNNRFWSANFQSIDDFLRNSDYEIFDEYGKKYTVDEFWNDAVGDSLYHGMTLDKNDDISDKWFVQRFLKTEFTSDGLRFCDSEFK